MSDPGKTDKVNDGSGTTLAGVPSAWRERLCVWGEGLRAGLWPVPVLMGLGAFALHALAAWLDRRFGEFRFPGAGWLLHSGTGQDAYVLLATLVSALVTVSSIVFSITIVTLTVAANQFGSRLVRTYMSDPRTKLSLGLFVATIVYCLLAMRSFSHDTPPEQVPHVTVTLGLVLGVAGVLMLAFFLHSVARSIVADEVIRRVAAGLEQAIGELETGARSCTPEALDPVEPGRAALLRCRAEGYVQAVQYPQLVQAARARDAIVHLTFRPGCFMCQGGWLAHIEPPQALDEAMADAVHAAVLVGPLRTPTQDLEFAMRHLVDVALRALSPGINDANTAIVVVDRLRGALSTLMVKRLPPAQHRDEQGCIRVVAPCHTYADLIDYAFDQIRRAASAHTAVVLHLLGAISRLAEHVQLAEQADALRRQAALIAAAGLEQAQVPADRLEISRALDGTLGKLSVLFPPEAGEVRDVAAAPVEAHGVQARPGIHLHHGPALSGQAQR